MKNQASWTKAQRELAKAKGKSLYLVAFDDAPAGGNGINYAAGLMDRETAERLFWFGLFLYHGKPHEEAYNIAFCGGKPEQPRKEQPC